MKKQIIPIIIVVCAQFIHAQDHDVTIVRYKNDGNQDIYAKNLSGITQKVALQLETTGYKKHPDVITKSVSPKDSLLLITLISSGGKTQMKSRYSYAPDPTKKEKAAKEKALQKRAYKKGDDITRGIVIFDKSDCPRCDRTTNDLLEKGIDFTWARIPTNSQVRENKVPAELKANQILLSQKMQENGVFGRYTTPVILVDGKLTHSHENLKEFVANLLKK